MHAALAYDGIRIMMEAMKRAQTPPGERFLEEIGKTKDFMGLTGPLTFGTDRQLRRPIFIVRRAGAVFETLKRYDPQ